MRIFKTLALILTMAPGLAAAHDDGFRVMGNSMPPFGIVQNDRISGFSIDLLKQVYMHAGLNFEDNHIVNAPFARMYNEMKTKHQRLGMHVALSPEREALFKWIGPYYEVSMGLIGKKSAQFEIKDAKDINAYKVGVVRDTLPAQILARLDVDKSQIIATPGPENALMMLAANRIDVFAHLLDVSRYIMASVGLDPQQYEQKFSLKTTKLYFAVSKDTSDETVLRLQDGLVAFFKSPQCKGLHKRYHLMNDFCAVATR